jgi:hypothetical protein
MHHDSFNADFYVTVATVIPLLYVTLALQGSTYRALIKQAFLLFEKRFRPDIYEIMVQGEPEDSLADQRNPLKFGLYLIAASIIWWAGFIGEAIVIGALFLRKDGPAVRGIALLAMLGLLVFVAIEPMRAAYEDIVSDAKRAVRALNQPKATPRNLSERKAAPRRRKRR